MPSETAAAATASSVAFGALTARAGATNVTLSFTTTSEVDITDFQVWRTPRGLGELASIGTVTARNVRTAYSFTDASPPSSRPLEYWIVARSSARKTVGAIGPVTLGTPASAKQTKCTIGDAVSCGKGGYFEGLCGQLDVRINLGAGAAWSCDQAYRTWTSGLAAQPTARANTHIVKPWATVDGNSVTRTSRNLLDVTTGTQLLADTARYFELDEYRRPGELTAMAVPLRESVSVGLSGADIDTCAEYGFRSVDSFARWKEHTDYTPMTNLEKVGAVFSGARALVSISGSTYTNTARDSDNVATGDVISRTTAPRYSHTIMDGTLPNDQLLLWSRTLHRPASRTGIRYTNEDWAFHHQHYLTAVANGWSSEELDTQWELIGDFTQLIGRFGELEMEKLRTLLEDQVRVNRGDIPRAWRTVNQGFRDRGISENKNGLACRWDRFAAIGNTVAATGHDTGRWYGQDLRRLETQQGRTMSPMEQDALFAGRPGDFGGRHDPLTGTPGAPKGTPRPKELGGGDLGDPPPDMPCGGPVDPVEEDYPLSSYPTADAYLDWRIAQIEGIQADLARRIDELYDRLDLLCQPRAKCEWAPSLLLRRLDDHYQTYRTILENTCTQNTGDDLVDLGRLFRVAPASAFAAADASRVTALQNTSWATSVTAMHPLWAAIDEYRGMFYGNQAQSLRKLARHAYKSLPKDGDNKAALVSRDGVERSRSADLFQVGLRAQSEGGIECPITDALRNEILADQNKALDYVCNCFAQFVNDGVVNAQVVGQLAETEVLRYFIDQSATGPQFLFIGLDGQEVGVIQEPNRVTFELRYDDRLIDGVSSFLTSNGIGWSSVVGPVPVTVRGAAVGVLGARVDWSTSANQSVCDPSQLGQVLSNDIRVYGGLELHPMISVGVAGLVSAGVEGWVKVFDLGVDQRNSYQMARRSQLSALSGQEQAGILSIAEAIGCDPLVLAQTQSVEQACPALLGQICDGNFEILDTIFQTKHQRDWGMSVETLGGGIAVFVELLWHRFSKTLFTWRGLHWQIFNAFHSEDVNLFSSQAGSEESSAALPAFVQDVLRWPFLHESAPPTSDAPFCPGP